MKTILYLITFIVAALINTSAQAVSPDVTIANTVTQAMAAAASNTIMPQAIVWLGTFMGLQFLITNYSLILNENEIGSVVVKLASSVAWFGICAYILYNGPAFIDAVGNGILTKYAPNIPGPGSIIVATLSLCTSILIGIAATGTSIAGIGNSSIAMVLVYALFIVFFIGMYMSIKILMLHLELGLIVVLAPLSFSFLGLKALKDQGIAPFKSLISLTYRIIVMGIICSAFSEVIDVAGANLDKVSWANPLDWADKLNGIFAAISAFPVLAFLVFKSDTIASSLASGSTNMGAADVASAAAAGAAMGATAVSAASAGVNSGASAIQSMSNFMKTSGGEVSNASSRGTGQTPSQAPSRAASMSTSAGGASPAGGSAKASSTDAGSAPVRPTSAKLADSPGVGPSGPGGADAAGANTDSSGGPSSTSDRAQASSDRTGGAPVRPAGEQLAGSSGVSPSGPSSADAVSAKADSAGIPSSASGRAKASSDNTGSAPIRPASAGLAGSPGVAPSRLGGSDSAGARMDSAAGELPSEGDAQSTNLASDAQTQSQASGGAPVRPDGGDSASTGDAPVRSKSDANAGNGSSAGIAAPLEQKLDKLTDVLLKQGQQGNAPRKPSLAEKIGELNRHVAQEKATTSVSISTHHSD